MTKTLTKVGNSQAVIIPKALINKYNLHTVQLIEQEDGILIMPDREASNFEEKVKELRAQKQSIYKKMEAESADLETIEYYDNNSMEDVDVDIVD